MLETEASISEILIRTKLLLSASQLKLGPKILSRQAIINFRLNQGELQLQKMIVLSAYCKRECSKPKGYCFRTIEKSKSLM